MSFGLSLEENDTGTAVYQSEILRKISRALIPKVTDDETWRLRNRDTGNRSSVSHQNPRDHYILRLKPSPVVFSGRRSLAPNTTVDQLYRPFGVPSFDQVFTDTPVFLFAHNEFICITWWLAVHLS